MPETAATTQAPDTDLPTKLAETEKSLADTRAALSAAERQRTIDRELWAAGAIDLETAAILVESATASADQSDIAAAVADLKLRQPFLFRAHTPTKPFLFRPPPPPPAMPAHAERTTDLGRAAAEARDSGDRRAVMRYL